MALTHVLMIVDRSGSMYNLASDVRGGFNSYVDTLRADADATYRLTVCLFDDETDILCTAAKLAQVPALTAQNYEPGGMTALLDAVGKTVAQFDRGTDLDGGDRVLVVVQTDGLENASKEYTYAQIKKLIADKEATGRWSFIYLGAGANAWDKGGDYGFRNTVNTVADSGGTRVAYGSLATASGLYSRGASGQSVNSTINDTAGAEALGNTDRVRKD